MVDTQVPSPVAELTAPPVLASSALVERKAPGPAPRQMQLPSVLSRFLPAWSSPEWLSAERWRRLVRNQPIAMACRETLIMNIQSLKWRLEARDPKQADELKDTIDNYTWLIRNIEEGGYLAHTSLICQDFLDIPFGGASELVRQDPSNPKSEVLRVIPIDGGTLFPTNDYDYPVGQKVAEVPAIRPVYFPRDAVRRMYSTPRPELKRKGWGMAAPERIYLAIELLFRGDRYYANLLLDTPEAGILDLGDMEGESARAWLESWRTILTGIDPFKVPVLYEHTTEAKFL